MIYILFFTFLIWFTTVCVCVFIVYTQYVCVCVCVCVCTERASLIAQTVNNLPTMQETWVRSLSLEDSMEKGLAIHSSIPAGRIPWTEEPGRLQSMRLQRVRHDWATNTFTFHFKYMRQAKSSSHENHHLGTGIYLHYNMTRFSILVYILISHSR